MVSDQEIARGVEILLRQSDPNAVTSLNGVVQQLGAKLGQDLSHKAEFINDQISLLRSQVQQPVQHPAMIKDHFALLNHPQFAAQQQFYSHLALQQQHQQQQQYLYFQQQQQQHQYRQPPLQPQVQQQAPSPVVARTAAGSAQHVASNAASAPKESATSGTKRRGGPGGLNKVCGVSPELQAIVGQPAMPRTEIVKQLWVYIRKHNLQDPGNKRKIICNDALRALFETDCTDMFKMNKLLAKHITALDPSKAEQADQAKRLKVEADPMAAKVEAHSVAAKVEVHSTAAKVKQPDSSTVAISDALAKFFGSEEKEIPQTEAFKRIWEYIKLNQLEDPVNSMVIVCDAKLQELLECESISALEIPQMLARRHFV
ncbi:uncharacterized protein [Nicotiana sylvestris]|uniref:DM2 domain-containing protein n=2 Tax=Nicotiana TaxID=4085 RepID=A0A1S4CBC4_TOBAC|nr:PREDICTED: uncharacterized protein LOC104221287 [Nicotiana sylvestris]XP_009770618.1 PREDICTED: uncharacterized protein LOC104221287 [Nicotiana sylvestris]XP_016498419.1 PREDICTED: uncharacterized protein LOC107817159 [Nicotiana tabacum]XP_016498421.1 PREDICTED: uncharacterized protein LOC107817159 [Nicotiana tabacum]